MTAEPTTDEASSRTPLSSGRGTAASVLSTVLSAYPVMVLGPLAPLLAADVGLSASAVGSVVGAFFLTSAVTSVRGGRLSERFGWSRVVLVGGLLTAIVVAAGAALVRRPLELGVLAALLGVANGLIQPAATEVLSAAVPASRQGPAFGAKHAAVPAASLLAGLAIPTVAVTFGWRWTFAAIGVLVVPLAACVPWGAGRRRPPRAAVTGTRAVLDRALVLTAVGAGLVTAAANALAAYLVAGAVAGGIPLATAGLLLSACSVACVVTRFASGFVPTARRGYLTLVVVLCGTGTVGYLLVATSGGATLPFAIGAVLAFAGGWGWSAVLGLGVVRDHPTSSASATCVLHAGTFAGGVAGPVLFGVVLGLAGFAVAWWVAAALSAGGLACFVLVRRPVGAVGPDSGAAPGGTGTDPAPGSGAGPNRHSRRET